MWSFVLSLVVLQHMKTKLLSLKKLRWPRSRHNRLYKVVCRISSRKRVNFPFLLKVQSQADLLVKTVWEKLGLKLLWNDIEFAGLQWFSVQSLRWTENCPFLCVCFRKLLCFWTSEGVKALLSSIKFVLILSYTRHQKLPVVVLFWNKKKNVNLDCACMDLLGRRGL